MPLTPGTRLGPYEIVAALGAGGMGEVYRARDARLNRDVAIKTLPVVFASDRERVARFEREARTLAALNHPNIAHIYGLEESNHVLALAIELVEGEDLAERLSRSPVPLQEALAIARQIADALEAAHEHGIIHRDLKPANIRVRFDGTVKVLDFGLAKAFDAAPTAVEALANSPTLTNTATELGVILGTAAYMAPEQAKGKVVDKRADIWAFGVVVYELLTGSRLFSGDTSTEILARVIEREPDWARLPAGTPDSILRLLHRCLTKDPKQRLQSIGDARLEIDDALSGAPVSPALAVAPRRRERAWAAIAVAALVAALALGVIVVRSSSRAPGQAPIRAAVALPPGQYLDGFGPPEMALSKDGRTLAFVARGASGVQHLYVRSLDSESATLVPGSDTVEGPFFSPDGRWVAFAVGVSIIGAGVPPELRKYSLETGLTQTICRIDDYFGGVWAADNSIVYSGAQPNGLWEVGAGGGQPEPVAASFIVDGKDVKRAVFWPDLLPGGQTLLVSDVETGSLAVVDRRSRRLTNLGLQGSAGRVLPGGYLVYASPSAALMAVGFDVRTLRVTGTPVALLPDIALARNNSPAFAFSDSGIFVYATGYLRGSRREPMRLVRATPTGQTTVLPFEPALFRRGFTLSPDGTTLAADTWDESTRWLFDLERHTRTRLPREGIGESYTLAWTRDGRVLTMAGHLVGSSSWGVFNQKADGSGGLDTILAPVPIEVHVAGWTEDGQALALWGGEPNNIEMRLMRLDRGQPVRTIRKELGAIYSAKISPDGRWLAFDSTATGQAQIYVVPFSDGGTRVAVSSGGGVYPVWSRDGKELFFRRDRAMIAVEVMATSDAIRFGPERRLFDWDIGREFVVGRRGDFYGVEPVPGAALQTSIQLRTNWFDEVRRLVGR